MTREDRDFFRTVVTNQDFQRIFSLLMEDRQREMVDYTRQCLRRNPPLIEEAIRSEAAATAFGDMLQMLNAEVTHKTHQGE